MGITSIEWTSTILPDGKIQKGMTWNPITGCSKISPGCANCYAERMAKRLKGRFGYPAADPFRVAYHPDKINDPLKWIKPRKVFVCSMGDIFHEDVEDWMLDNVFNRICHDGISHLTFIVLTKRPERMQEYCSRDHISAFLPQRENIWLGVTVENQEQANKRIVPLLQTPAAVRFISIEPMLGTVNLRRISVGCPAEGDYLNSLTGYETLGDRACTVLKLDWVIVGGETGPGARRMEESWLQDLCVQLQLSETPLFVKQTSGRNAWNRHYPLPDYAKIRMFPGDKYQ